MRDPTRLLLVLLALLSVVAGGQAVAPALREPVHIALCVARPAPAALRPLAVAPRPVVGVVAAPPAQPLRGHAVRHHSRGPPPA